MTKQPDFPPVPSGNGVNRVAVGGRAQLIWALALISGIWTASDVGYYFALPLLGQKSNYNDDPIAAALYYAFWVGIVAIAFWPQYASWPRYATWATFENRLTSMVVWSLAFAVSVGFAAYVLDQRGHGRSGGRRGHLSRFSQLLGDLQAFRRAVRLRSDRPVPQVVFGHSFGGLVVLRYLETQPSDPLTAAIVSAPSLGLAFQPTAWKLLLGRLLEDLWPTFALRTGIDTDHLSRDPAINAAYETDAAVHDLMTAGAWREMQWARRAVAADGDRIDTPLLFLLAGEDRISDAHLARAFADSLKTRVQVRWYAEMYHEVLNDPQRDQALGDIVAFLRRTLDTSGSGGYLVAR